MQTVVDDAVDDAATFELVCAIELEYIEHQKYIYCCLHHKTKNARRNFFGLPCICSVEAYV